MSGYIQTFADKNAWYTLSGNERDVVLSTRARIARNLANFQFHPALPQDDISRIRSLLIDAFASISMQEGIEDGDLFQILDTAKLEPLQKRVLFERGIISPAALHAMSAAAQAAEPVSSTLIIREDGCLSAMLNDRDHYRISGFVAGEDIEGAWNMCSEIDEGIQQNIQVAANHEFGFLTSNFKDAGTGVKTSLYVHLPSITLAGNIVSVVEKLSRQGFAIEAVYGVGNIPASALGAYYKIYNMHSSFGSRAMQITALQVVASYIVEIERKARLQIAEQKMTVLKDTVYKSYGAAQLSKFLTEKDAAQFLSDIKLGRDTELITGFEDDDFAALLYRIKEAHLAFTVKAAHFSLEDDVASNPALVIPRMRSLVVHEALENARITF